MSAYEGTMIYKFFLWVAGEVGKWIFRISHYGVFLLGLIAETMHFKVGGIYLIGLGLVVMLSNITLAKQITKEKKAREAFTKVFGVK